MSTLKIALISLVVLAAGADTVTTRDSSSWNGTVTQIQAGVLQLKATFSTASPPPPLKFGTNYLRAIEFNNSRYNPGADPTNLLNAMLAKQTGGQLPGTVYMLDKTQKPRNCKNITVDTVNVSCDGMNIDRKGVFRILIATQ